MVSWIPIFFSDQPLMTLEKLAEGVGFEPTVGFPTLDFESSALNQTQPPFLEEKRKHRTSNIQPASARCYGAAGIKCNSV
jgi:hypothetical protein